jgi:diadenosine tetraphosphate (Ap4A) HIT family hydrolase
MRVTSPQVEREGGAYNEDTMVHGSQEGRSVPALHMHVHGSGKIDKKSVGCQRANAPVKTRVSQTFRFFTCSLSV